MDGRIERNRHPYARLSRLLSVGPNRGGRYPDHTPLRADNDYAALLRTPEGGGGARAWLVREAPETGICRVVTTSPNHGSAPPKCRWSCPAVIVCGSNNEDLSRREGIGYVQIFRTGAR